MSNNRNNCQNESKVRSENPFKTRTIADSLVIKENEHSKRSLDRLRLNKQFLFVSFFHSNNVINQTHAVSVPRERSFIRETRAQARDSTVSSINAALIVILSDSNMADTRS